MVNDFGSSAPKNDSKTGKPVADEIMLGNEHFLSTTNPVATVDQRDLEALALRVLQTEEVKTARDNAGSRLKILAGENIPAEAWDSFESVLDEWVYQNAIKAVNSDPNHPKVLGCIFEPAHEWFGMKIPAGVGFGGVNPDNNYSVVPIDGRARFELHGRRFEPGPVDVQFTVAGNFFVTITLANLDWSEVQVNPDGTFVITFDSECANGRPNHMQTGPDATYLLIRDVRGDWRQVPNAYRIKRLDPPIAPPLTFQQIVDRTAQHISDDVAGAHLYIAMNKVQPINVIRPPFPAGNLGGLVSQMMTSARVKIADDEAFIVTVGSEGTKYHVLPLYNYWQCTMATDRHTSCMNSEQSIANSDGSTTYVISIKDPGVHNWLDTIGLHEPRFWIRWHLLADKPASGDGPSIKGEIVKLSALKHVLPKETKWLSPAQRKQQLAERLETFRLRYVDS